MYYCFPFLQAINPGGWTRTQEVSNGRAAIAGLVAAFIAEKTVHTSAFDQLFGAAGGAPWAKPLFFAVVAVFIGITATGVLVGVLGGGRAVQHARVQLFDAEPV